MTIAILSALREEQDGLLHAMTEPQKTRRASRTFWRGKLDGHDVVLALSRIGKVAAAATTATLLEHFGVRAVLFTGVAGGVGQGVAVGDVVIASGFVQYDMDASPIFPRFEVPATGKMVFPTDATWSQRLLHAAQSSGIASTVGNRNAATHSGLIATGDRFIASADEARAITQSLNAVGLDALAVEMEGAAVAQVCADYGIPMAAMRTISDRADATAHGDFAEFVQNTASVYAYRIIRACLQQCSALESVPAHRFAD